MKTDPDQTSSTARQLLWAVQRLATSQGILLERLQVHSALTSLSTFIDPRQQIDALCLQFGWPTPTELDQPDPANLPTLVHHSTIGWCLLVAKNADDSWLAHTPQGSTPIQIEARSQAASFALVLPRPDKRIQRARDMIKQAFWDSKSMVMDGALATVMINCLALASSLFSMQVYDRVIPTQGIYTLGILATGVCLAIAFEFVLKIARAHVMEYAVVGMDAHLSRNIFQRLLNVRLDQLPPSVGTLAGQLRSYEGIRAFLTASTVYVLIDVPFALIFIAIIGFLATPSLLLVPLVFLALSLVTGILLRQAIESSAKAGVRESNFKTGLLVEAVEGAETIKSGQGGWRFLSRWMDITDRAIRHDVQVRRLSEWGGYVTSTFQQLSYVSLVAVGAWLVIDGQMTMGALIACTTLSGRALAPIGMLPGLLVQYAHARAALDSLEIVYALGTENDGVERPLVPERLHGNYRFDDVRYSYRSVTASSVQNRLALHLPRLEIRAGDKVGVLGPVGSGKSTLLRLLSGLHQPQEGKLTLDGLELSHISRQRVSEQVGFLQQDHRLFEGSLRENLLIGLPDPGDDAIHEAATQTGLMDIVADHPRGFDQPISEGGTGLSGGQKQLVALTRMFLTQPNIWLLDEPTAHMDEDLERRCLNALKVHLNAERTAVIVTHKASVLSLVSHLIIVSKHRILLSGTKQEVLEQLQRVSSKASQ